MAEVATSSAMTEHTQHARTGPPQSLTETGITTIIIRSEEIDGLSGRLPPAPMAINPTPAQMAAAPRGGAVDNAVMGPLQPARMAQILCLTETEPPRPAVTATDLSAPGLSAQPRPRRGQTPRLM